MSKNNSIDPYPYAAQPAWAWGDGFIPAVKAIRAMDDRNRLGLKETLDLMANEFGFETWGDWQVWLRENRVNFTSVRGPYALVILKAIAAKHDRRNVSTGR